MTLDLTAVILTFNEERHIARCISSVAGLAREVVVVDSFSSDSTCEIARSQGARVLTNPFVNQAIQLNWAIDHGRLDTRWVLRLDADEVVSDELARALREQLPTLPADVAGITVNRRIFFQGRWIRHGGIYPRRTLRLWRRGSGHCEQRWMDEHVLVAGRIRHVDADISDINLHGVTSWIDKHNKYATREAIETLLARQTAKAPRPDEEGQLHSQARVVRLFKQRVYQRLPAGVRSSAYFGYRYLVRLGFLDGWQGLAFHGLQGLWYRFLVDVKVRELESLMRERDQPLARVVKDEFGYEL